MGIERRGERQPDDEGELSPEGEPEATNLLERPAATVHNMAKVEGDDWLREQLRDLNKEFGAFDDSVIEQLRQWNAERLNAKTDNSVGVLASLKQLERWRREPPRGKDVAHIYGKGGSRRWYVDTSGNVSLSGGHKAAGATLEQSWGGHVLAEKLGFEIHDPNKEFEEGKELYDRLLEWRRKNEGKGT